MWYFMIIKIPHSWHISPKYAKSAECILYGESGIRTHYKNPGKPWFYSILEISGHYSGHYEKLSELVDSQNYII